MARAAQKPDESWQKVFDWEVSSEEAVSIEGSEITLTNVEHTFWSEAGVTKGELLKYYIEVAPYILPHLKDRPLRSDFKRNPHDPGERINDMHKENKANRVPGFLDVYSTPRLKPSPGKRNIVDYPICNNLASLVWLVNVGSIDINPWFSRVQSIDNPDYLIIDLDPTSKKKPFSDVIDVALAFKDLLDELKIKSYPKTSGKTGFHVYIPLGAKYTFDEVKPFAKQLAQVMHERMPQRTTVAQRIAERGDKIYLDYIQGSNKYRSVASVYSVRPTSHPNVSTPLEWKEVKPGLEPTDFTIRNVIKRVQKKGDLFAPVMGKGIDMNKAMSILRML